MSTVNRARTITAEPEAIWGVLADFGGLSTWADGVDHSCLLHDSDDPVGRTRRVQVGHETLVETIVAFDAPRELAYDIAGVPRWFSVSNRWNLHSDSSGLTTVALTTVTLTSTVRMRPHPLRPIAIRMFMRLMAKRSDELLNSLAKHLERTT
ncbi:MAG: SRPBCC family protein [Mycobacterium sp.]